MSVHKSDNQFLLRQMIKKYVSGKATPAEVEFLEAYFDHFETGENILDQLPEEEKRMLEEEMNIAIMDRVGSHRTGKVFYLRMAAAVLVGAILTIGFYLYPFNKKQPQALVKTESKYRDDIDPGGNKAVLTLADGRKISLDDAGIGQISRQGNTIVSKTNAGQVIYDLPTSSTGVSSIVTYNTIQTPIGGEFQIVLPDGTKVWLNSNSKLEFPTTFVGNDRIVKLSGEGYFEVAKNIAMPFRVKVNDIDVKVLGTHFNIMAYADEADVRTTLLEGSINISKGSIVKLIEPGQQALVGIGNNIIVSNGDLDAAVAWKNGYFKFNKDNIQSVMRQLSRWYDMEVVYKGEIPKDEFSGKIRRNIKVSKALQFLELTDLHFKIEGKKVTVLE